MHCSVHQRLFSARSIVLTVASQCFYETDSMITNSGLWLPFLLRGEGKKPESLDNQARGQRVPILINFLMYQALFSWRFEPKRNQKQKSSKRLKISVPHIVFRKRWMQLTLQTNVKYWSMTNLQGQDNLNLFYLSIYREHLATVSRCGSLKRSKVY